MIREFELRGFSDRDLLLRITLQQEQIMTGLSDLQTQVAALQQVAAQAITILQGIPAQIQAAVAAEDGSVETLAQTIAQQTAQLQTAVTAAAPASASTGSSGTTTTTGAASPTS